jgi:toxin ParE1/3/4
LKRFRVFIIQEAEEDLLEIYMYVSLNDSVGRADYVLTQLEACALSLSTTPYRGHVCPELDRIGISDYRELHFKPYRVIYEIAGQTVYIHAVLDGRRDLPSLLERRFTRQSGSY